ncbi:beta strand repeat-containing protein [Flavobacterium daemonense]|uniref:beta strand repeat-containing protein n=1 Tax=Flavobacterium daemonense TaxID=1393049 RepID=UPI001185BADA|nr:hypothetical protein [Flavobacterium daemonense]KAF2337222.1 hypothetical protein FND99_02075 [Flavobacterium daemonense]
MAQKHINTDIPNSGNGDALRDAFNKTEDNFNELYANKVDKVSGKGLSTNDYTTADKTKLDGIPADAEKNVQADFLVNDPSSDAYIKNKPAFVTAVNWGDITGDITNQSDLQNALAEKTDFAYVDGKITQTISSGTTDFAPSEDAVFNALSLKQDTAQKNTANGYAGLDASGKVFSNQLPALAISETFVVASQSAMLALSGAEQGDIAVRTDVNKTFILKQSPYSTLANWQELLTPTDAVTSVFGRVGAVVANSGDYTTALVPDTTNKRYQTDAQAARNDATSSIQTQLDSKQPLITNNITGTGANGQLSFFNGTNTLAGDSALYWNNTTKRLSVNGTTNPSTILEVRSEGQDNLYLANYNNSFGVGANIVSRRYGGTKALPTATLNTYVLTGLYGGGYDGTTDGTYTAAIRFIAGEDFTSSGQGTTISFDTTPLGSVVRTEKFKINGNGSIQINTTPTTSTTGYDILTRNASTGLIEKALNSGFLHTTGDETFTGLKTAINTGSTSNAGIVLTNSATGGTQVLNVTNTDNAIGARFTTASGSTGIGAYFNNLGTSVAEGIRVRTAAGFGLRVENDDTGTGVYLNSNTVSTGDLLKIAKSNSVVARIDSNGMYRASNTGTGSTVGIDVYNGGSSGTQVININNASTGVGQRITNNSTGTGFAITNVSTGVAQYIANASNGNAIALDNAGTGAGIVLNSNTGSNGDLIAFRKNSTGTLRVDSEGMIRATNNGTTATNGIDFTNSGSAPQIINVINNSTGVGQRVTNNGTGSGILLANTSTGWGTYISNQSTGNAFGGDNISGGTMMYFNSMSGSTGDLLQFRKNSVLTTKFDQNGLMSSTNTSSAQTAGISLTNAGSSGSQVLITNSTGGGRGAVFQSNNGSIAAAVENSGAGSGFYISNISTGRGATFDNVSTGALTILNSQTASTGDLLRFTKNGATTTYFDQNGLFNASNTTTTQTTGALLVNSATGASQVLTVSNTSGGRGILLTNGSTGTGLVTANNGAGIGLYVNNVSTGVGYQSDNQTTGALMSLNSVSSSTGDLLTFRKNSVLTTKFDQNGLMTSTNTGTTLNTGIALTNNGTTVNGHSLKVTNTSTGVGTYIDNQAGGSGEYINNAGAGNGLNIQNTSSGRGLYAVTSNAFGIGLESEVTGAGIGYNAINQSTGTGYQVINNSTGKGFFAQSSSASGGNNFVANVATGSIASNFLGQNNGTTTFSVDRFGNIVASTYSGSATLTGTPTAPTAAAGTSTTQIATTAFVANANANVMTVSGAVQNITSAKNFNNPNSTSATLNTNVSGTGTAGFVATSSNNGIAASFVNFTTSRNGDLVNIQNQGSFSSGALLGLTNNGGSNDADLIQGYNTTGGTLFKVAKTGIVTGNGFVKQGGASTEFLMADGSVKTDARPYKSYVALLTQTGTSAPVATVLENSIGSIVWTRSVAGTYDATLTGAFTANKTVTFLTDGSPLGSSSAEQLHAYYTSANVTTINTRQNGTSVDGLLTKATVEIRVYP